MHCLVTAGPTFEPLDQVRRLTNFSTGRLGSELALHLARAGHTVRLLRSETAIWPAPEHPRLRLESFTTTARLREQLAAQAEAETQAVFHAAAVCDFAPGRVWRREPDGQLSEVRAGKLSTRDGPWLVELAPTPKLLARLRAWFPRAWLVGWKYEVDGTRARALAAGAIQLTETDTDLCVVNGPAYGPGFGLVTRETPPHHCPDRAALLEALLAGLNARAG